MKPGILVLGSILVLAAVAFVAFDVKQSLAARAEEQRAAAAAESATSAKLAATLEKLSARVDEMERRALEAPRVEREVAKIDDAIAALKAKADADPSNPDAQVELAAGYLQKLNASKNMIETGGWATKMDQCYDKALEVDPNHWQARFSKAISYSFWPAITGKPQESVKQFEILVAQQEKSAVRPPSYAMTYQMLGNMYKQQGKLDLAKQTYAKGLSFFPDNNGLKTSIDGLKP